MSAGVGLTAVLTPLIAGSVGAVVLFVKRTRHYRDAAARSSQSRAEIDRILLDARIREAQKREAESKL
jgi:hypothetical protein